MGIELRNRLEVELGVTLQATLIWTYPTVATLAEHLGGKLLPRATGGGQVEPPDPAADVDAEEAAALQRLSEEEKIALLDAELSDLDEILSS